MTSKEYFLPLKRTDYFLYCGEKLISVNSLKTNDCNQEEEPTLALDIYRMTFPKINNPNFRCYVDMYMKYMYTKYEIKPHEINRYAILRRYIVVACFSFLFYRVDIVFWKRIWKKKRKEKKNTRTRSYFGNTREVRWKRKRTIYSPIREKEDKREKWQSYKTNPTKYCYVKSRWYKNKKDIYAYT